MTPRDEREAADDSAKSYEAALRAIRERNIRAGDVKPNPGDPEEQEWAREGKAK